MSKDRYLVTGGAGFIGSHIVEFLLGRGRDVRVLDNFSTGFRENLEEFSARIEIVEGDIRDEETVKRAVKGCSYVLHQAALPSVDRSVADPLTAHSVNVAGTLNLLLAARDAGVRRFVYASSSSVYGDSPMLPKREEMSPCPMSPYAVTKIAGEYYCGVFCRLYGLQTVSLRYFNVFGPKQNPDSQYAAVIPNFFVALCGGGQPVVHGDGKQTRDFTFVKNVAEVNAAACAAGIKGGEVFNIACGERISINGVLGLVQEAVGVFTAPRHDNRRAGDVRDSLADITRAREKLGYRPSIDLKEGLRLTADYYRSRVNTKETTKT